MRQIRNLSPFLFALLPLVGCGGSDSNGSSLTCGTGTTQVGSMCMPVAAAAGMTDAGSSTGVTDAGAPGTDAGAPVADAGGLACGPGTMVSGSTCVIPPAAQITQARLSLLDVQYDVTKPVFVNNALPIQFGITAKSVDVTKPATTPVTVVFTFVEANPADPANPGTCDSNGIVVNLVGDGVEHQFSADIYPTSDCAFASPNAIANLAVDFDRALRLGNTPTGIDYPPVTFSAANATAANNQLCHTSKKANATTGCVYALKLQPTPVGTNGQAMIDVKISDLTPESSVAVLWPTKVDPAAVTAKPESDQAAIVVNASFVMNGRDPYEFMVNAAELPAGTDPTLVDDANLGLTQAQLDALDDLPGTAAIKYDIAPTNLIAANGWMPLTIDDPKNPDPDGHVTEIDLTELQPGTESGETHALYIEGATLTKVTTDSVWSAQNDFTIRGCIVASFPEGGDQGDESDESDEPVGGDVPSGDCKTFKVTLVRTPLASTSASAYSFDQSWSRTVGNTDRISLSGSLSTSNTLDLNGARSDTEGNVSVQGHIGKDFSVQLFRAWAKAGALTAQASSYVDVGVDAFGNNVFGYQDTESSFNYTTTFGVAKSFQFPGLAFGFGPVSIGITAGIGGNVGLTPTINVSAADGPGQAPLDQATSNGTLVAQITPNVGLTGNVTGGVSAWIVSATAVATLQVVDIGFPVTGTLNWGVTGTDPNSGNVTQLTGVGNVTFDLTLNWLNVSCDLIGKIGSKKKTINIFKYNNSPETFNLLTRQLDTITLQ